MADIWALSIGHASRHGGWLIVSDPYLDHRAHGICGADHHGFTTVEFVVEFMMNATLGPQSSVTIVLTMLSGMMVAEGRHDELIEVGAPIFWAIRNSGPVESMLLTWGTDLAEAYLGRADSASAGEILDSMTGLVAHLPRESIRAGIARAEALRDEHVGQLSAAEVHATEAVTLFEHLGWPVEHGRSLLVRAHIRYRSHAYRAAFTDAEAAKKVFDAAGSVVWTTVATSATERFGRTRRSSSNERTAMQDRVAEALRRGLSNHEIGAASHISVKTVEAHLTTIYRQSGVKSRSAFLALT